MGEYHFQRGESKGKIEDRGEEEGQEVWRGHQIEGFIRKGLVQVSQECTMLQPPQLETRGEQEEAEQWGGIEQVKETLR